MIYANVTFDRQKRDDSFLAMIQSNSVVKAKDVYDRLGLKPPSDMIELIENYSDSIHKSITTILAENTLPVLASDKIQYLSPIPFPRRNVFCLGKNYADHANEVNSITGGKGGLPENPIYFTKSAYPCIGDGDVILNHSELTDQLDYEVELAVIIKKKGRNIPLTEAEDYVFGYSIGNDISARNLQFKHVQWFKGKSLDTCCAIGPYIVHKGDIPFPPALDIECRVNGEIRQKSNTSKMIYDIPAIIHDLSQGLTLYPGDIVLTGTPSGVGMGFTPPKLLKPGEVVQCYIEGIGTLTNYVES